MTQKIPAPIIAILSEYLPKIETHATIDSRFMYADAPGEPPEESKPAKVTAWLQRINQESEEPLKILGRLIESYIEHPTPTAEKDEWGNSSLFQPDPAKIALKEKLETELNRYNLSYLVGGIISVGGFAPSRSLAEIIKGRDIPAIEIEFERALKNIASEPREAVSAACNILESVFKTYIEDEKLEMPTKQDLQGVWKVVRSDLGFNPGTLEDQDLQRILSGVLSVVDGIGALRTHASSAHGQGRKIYKLESRHARLAVNAAHTIALFVIQTWDERKKNG